MVISYKHYKPRSALIAEAYGVLLGRVVSTFKQLQHNNSYNMVYNTLFIKSIVQGEKYRIEREGDFSEDILNSVKLEYSFKDGILTFTM